MKRVLVALSLAALLGSTVPLAHARQVQPTEERVALMVLAAPQLRTPANGTAFPSMGPVTLNWDLAPGSTQYQVQILPFNGDGPGVNLIRNAENSYSLSAPVIGQGPYIFLPGMTYSWRVRNTDKAAFAGESDPSWGPWSDQWTFTTPPPSATTIHVQEPAPGATTSSLTPRVVWTNDNSTIFYYEVQLSSDQQFNTDPNTATAAVYWNLVHGGQAVPVDSWVVPSAYPLLPNTRYSWRVRPRVQGDGTPVGWSALFSFVTPSSTPPPVPSPTATATPTVMPTATPTAIPTATPTASPIATGTWTNTGTMSLTRPGHTATLLSDGKVLVAGGGSASSELYDPATAIWSLTFGGMSTARQGHTATTLSTGKILVAGGGSPNSTTTDVYDPATGTWATAGPMVTSQSLKQHTATLLPNGKVLVAGGTVATTSQPIKTAQLYAVGGWTTTGSLNMSRFGHTATLLTNGKVLVVGGSTSPDSSTPAVLTTSAELYDPATGTWSMTGSMNVARPTQTANLLPNGKVLVTGFAPADVPSAELYDPVTGTWTVTGGMNVPRKGYAATLLASGRVLVAGGFTLSSSEPTRSVEIFDPTSGMWTVAASMNLGRRANGQSTTLLLNGKVLVAGGVTGSESVPTASAELYEGAP